MKKLILSTALTSALALSAVPGFAQTATDPAAPVTPDATAPAGTMTADSSPYLPGVQDGVRASDFIGKRVYVTEADTTGMSATAMAEAGADWEDAGEISDLIISISGDTEAVLVDFGGFLGIGEKTVALSLADLTMVPDADSPEDYFIVFHGSKAELEAAPAFDPDMVFDATQDSVLLPDAETGNATGATDGTMVNPAPDATAMTEATPDATTAPGESVDLATFAEEDLIGKRVYGPNDEDVGEISSVSLDASGKIEAAVVDVGGFLGIGEKPVALGDDMLTMVKEADGTIWFRVAATQDQLEAMQPYAG